MHRTLAVTSETRAAARPIHLVLVGLGPIGRRVADECLRRGKDRVVVVGAVDRDPNLVGKTLGDLWGPGRADGAVRVLATPAGLPDTGDVAVLATTSRLDALEPQLEALFARGLDVVSSAEELFYPAVTSEERARRIDALANRYGASVTGSGINPGFLMDVFPSILAVASGPPYTIRCERHVDLARSGPTLQARAGIGLEPEGFRRLAEAGQVGHPGVVESAAYLAGHLGIPVTTIDESLEPVVAESPFTWREQTYPAGRSIGYVRKVRAWGEGQGPDSAPIQLSVRMSYPLEDPRDRVVLSGSPEIDLTICPCVAGGEATAAMLVHLAAQIICAPPGLRLAHELNFIPQGPHYHIRVATAGGAPKAKPSGA